MVKKNRSSKKVKNTEKVKNSGRDNSPKDKDRCKRIKVFLGILAGLGGLGGFIYQEHSKSRDIDNEIYKLSEKLYDSLDGSQDSPKVINYPELSDKLSSYIPDIEKQVQNYPIIFQKSFPRPQYNDYSVCLKKLNDIAANIKLRVKLEIKNDDDFNLYLNNIMIYSLNLGFIAKEKSFLANEYKSPVIRNKQISYKCGTENQ